MTTRFSIDRAEKILQQMLSLVSKVVSFFTIFSFCKLIYGKKLKKAVEEDPYIQSMGRVATEQPGGSYKWHQGLLLYKGRVNIVPDNTTLKAKLLHEVHDTKVGGHSDVLRTLKKLRQQFYWPGIHRSVQDYVKGCEACHKIKVETLTPAELL